MKRLFAAVKIHPSPEFLKTYNSLKTGLKFSRITWVNPENIHITLKFFGETEEKRIPDISRVLKEVAARHNSFTSNWLMSAFSEVPTVLKSSGLE